MPLKYASSEILPLFICASSWLLATTVKAWWAAGLLLAAAFRKPNGIKDGGGLTSKIVVCFNVFPLNARALSGLASEALHQLC